MKKIKFLKLKGLIFSLIAASIFVNSSHKTFAMSSKERKPIINKNFQEDVENQELKYFFIPIEIKSFDANVCLKRVVAYFLSEKLTEKLNEKKITSNQIEPFFVKEGYIGMIYTNEETKEKIFNYIEKIYKNFIKEIIISKTEFNELKSSIKNEIIKNLTLAKKQGLKINNFLKSMENYIENIEKINNKKSNINKNLTFKLTEEVNKGLLYNFYCNIIIGRVGYFVPVYNDFNEMLKNKEKLNKFWQKHSNKNFNEPLKEPIDLEYIKDFKNNLVLPSLNGILTYTYFNNKMLAKLDEITFEDLAKTIKCADLVDFNKYEKEQKTYNELQNKIKGF